MAQVFAGSGPLTLNCRVNISQSAPKIQEALDSIQTSLGGVRFEFECDYASIASVLTGNAQTSYGDRLGDVVTWYLDPVAYAMRNKCADPLLRESVIELVPSRKISFRVFPNEAEYKKAASYGSYCRCRIVGGVLYIETCLERFCSNVDDVLSGCFTQCFAGDADFPLVLRTNIAQFTPRIEETLQKIETSTGVRFVFECDYAALYKQLPAGNSYKDRLAEMMQAYLEAMEYGLRTKCQDPLARESVHELCTARKIAFRVFNTMQEYKKACSWESSSYNRSRLVDGVLVMECPLENFCSNVDYVIRECFEKCFAGNSDFPLKLRGNISEYTPKIEEVLEEIEQSVGIRFEFEVDYAAMFKQVKASDRSSYAESLGELMHTYLKALKWGLENGSQKNALCKEAVHELCTAKKITFRIYDKRQDYSKVTEGKWENSYSYCRCRIVDGVLVMECPLENFCSNVDYVLSECFLDTFAGNESFPLRLRVNIAEQANEMVECLEEIAKHCGIKFEFECDYVTIYGALRAAKKKDYLNSLGSIMLAYVQAIKSFVSYRLTHPLRKEAVLELCTAKKLTFRLFNNQKEYKAACSWGDKFSYCRCRVESGVLFMEASVDNFPSNVDNILDSFDYTFMGDPAFPLAARVDIANNVEKHQAALDRLSAASGKAFTAEFDWPAIMKVINKSSSYENRPGEAMTWYLEPLASNVERLCADDLSKEAFGDKFPDGSAVVRFAFDDKAAGYCATSFEAPNVLVIRVQESRFCSNVDECGRDIEKQL